MNDVDYKCGLGYFFRPLHCRVYEALMDSILHKYGSIWSFRMLLPCIYCRPPHKVNILYKLPSI